MALVTAEVWVQSLTWQLLNASEAAEKEKKERYIGISTLKFMGVPSGLVVRTWCFDPCGLGSISGLGAKIPHQAAVQYYQKKRKKKEKKKRKGKRENKI